MHLKTVGSDQLLDSGLYLSLPGLERVYCTGKKADAKVVLEYIYIEIWSESRLIKHSCILDTGSIRIVIPMRFYVVIGWRFVRSFIYFCRPIWTLAVHGIGVHIP